MLKNAKVYKVRALALFLCFVMLFTVLCIRIAIIQNGTLSKVADVQSSRKILLDTSRGYIYDRNYIPLVNEEKESYCVYLTDMFNSQAINGITGYANENIKNGICISQSKINAEDSIYLKQYNIINRYSNTSLCEHIVGYTDSDNNGVSGIEKAFDAVLKNASGSLYAEYEANAAGYALSGSGINLNSDNFDSQAGIVLTIDKNIQKIAEDVIKESEISTGAVVVMDVNTFEIYALVSVPSFDRLNLSASLKSENEPFFNRALGAYPVGSVFKPIIATAAIENGISPYDIFVCDGGYEIGKNVFKCYNSNVHGKLDLNKAIEKSCNSYFIDLSVKIGKDKLYETASLFGFGKEISLCSTLISDAGNLPTPDEISSDSALANIGFGQGELLVTPLQLATAYCVLANGGYYSEPTVLKELVNEEKTPYAYYKSEISYSVCSKETCEKINTCLYNNMLNGTGVGGLPDKTYAAGKTATAQTGNYNENGEERLCTWFAGFFPYDSPKYAVVVFNENGSTASVDCAPVFKRIADKIMSDTEFYE